MDPLDTLTQAWRDVAAAINLYAQSRGDEGRGFLGAIGYLRTTLDAEDPTLVLAVSMFDEFRDARNDPDNLTQAQADDFATRTGDLILDIQALPV